MPAGFTSGVASSASAAARNLLTAATRATNRAVATAPAPVSIRPTTLRPPAPAPAPVYTPPRNTYSSVTAAPAATTARNTSTRTVATPAPAPVPTKTPVQQLIDKATAITAPAATPAPVVSAQSGAPVKAWGGLQQPLYKQAVQPGTQDRNQLAAQNYLYDLDNALAMAAAAQDINNQRHEDNGLISNLWNYGKDQLGGFVNDVGDYKDTLLNTLDAAWNHTPDSVQGYVNTITNPDTYRELGANLGIIAEDNSWSPPPETSPVYGDGTGGPSGPGRWVNLGESPWWVPDVASDTSADPAQSFIDRYQGGATASDFYLPNPFGGRIGPPVTAPESTGQWIPTWQDYGLTPEQESQLFDTQMSQGMYPDATWMWDPTTNNPQLVMNADKPQFLDAYYPYEYIRNTLYGEGPLGDQNFQSDLDLAYAMIAANQDLANGPLPPSGADGGGYGDGGGGGGYGYGGGGGGYGGGGGGGYGSGGSGGGGGGGGGGSVGGIPIGDVTSNMEGWASRYLPASADQVIKNPAVIGQDTINGLGYDSDQLRAIFGDQAEYIANQLLPFLFADTPIGQTPSISSVINKIHDVLVNQATPGGATFDVAKLLQLLFGQASQPANSSNPTLMGGLFAGLTPSEQASAMRGLVSNASNWAATPFFGQAIRNWYDANETNYLSNALKTSPDGRSLGEILKSIVFPPQGA